MAIFENFPYTNFHELNLDYILKRVKELEGEVADLTALLESGPVVDVKANVGGNWVSQKDGSGNVNLPAGNHSTIGGLKYESTSDTEEPYIALNNGGGWEKVPALDASDKIDASLLPPTTDVLMNVSGAWISVVDGNGDAQIRKASPTTFGAVKVESSNDLSARKMNIYADGQYDALPTLDANDQIDASAIPDSGVTAGTYGSAYEYSDIAFYIPYDVTVGSDGRLTLARQQTFPVQRMDYAVIAAGASTNSIYFNNAGIPWYNTLTWLNVNCYELTTTGKGDPMFAPLVHGTDYTYNITHPSSGSGSISVTLTATKSNPVYMIVNGCYGRSSM